MSPADQISILRCPVPKPAHSFDYTVNTKDGGVKGTYTLTHNPERPGFKGNQFNTVESTQS